ncbi:Crp/Fnr family transcriptional regulator [Lentilactobacillus curieae]|uniref:Crp/Fnr family transcriptional regulator n=2 Tax=Lentilactobacillus curieae TaxID=1138822 RepID=A0A1S6QH34_9LACO|nr:Crp/Fnr family transcriptional regulator [Lentilactobacillus curieae]
MDQHHALECINLVPMFNTLPLDQRQQLADLVVQKFYPKGTTIYMAGDKLGQFMIVDKGQLKVSTVNRDGKEQIIRVLLPGEFDGETALFSGNSRNATSVALTDSNICQISQTSFQQLLTKSPDLATNMMASMGSRITELENEKAVASTASVTEKVARYLLETSAGEKSKSFKLPLKKKDIAVYLGTTPETITRTLKKFAEQGLISTAGAKVSIIDEDGLALIV